jgi:uncharacterized repeat protein (TIGR03803 family)
MRAFKLFAILCLASACAGRHVQAQTVTLTTIYSFCAEVACLNPVHNYNAGAASLVQGNNGVLYGTTEGGGAYGQGTVYGITPSGELSLLYSFCANSECPDGSIPWFGLILATDGNFYGATTAGGASGNGTIFRMTPSGQLSTLYAFGSGYSPPAIYAGLVQATDGNLYGTTRNGGTSGNGTVFRITLGGTLTTLYSFTGELDGGTPQAPLVQATNGNLYGTTYSGGTNGRGTIFQITTGGAFNAIYSFAGTECCSQAGLVQASDGNLYGTNKFGGTSGAGSIFQITPSGQETTLHSFDYSDGSGPNSSLIQATDGELYGTTEGGGASGTGAIFKITLTGDFASLYQFSGAYSGPGNSIYAGLFQAFDGSLFGTTQNGGSAGDGTVFGFSIGAGPMPTPFYNGTELTIPSLKIGGATYTNVVVTLSGIFSIQEGAPNGIVVTYNPANNQLTLPIVFYAGATYANVVVTVGTLVSIGGITGADIYNNPELQIRSVQVLGRSAFSDVVITVDSIDGVGGGMPALTQDEYIPETRQLIVPAVQANGRVYTNAIVTVGTVVSVGP